jgi:ABC-2 type transport system ATP-binding protein
VIALDTPRGLRRLLPAERGLELTVEAEADPALAFAGVGERAETTPGAEGRWTVRLYGEDLATAAVAAADRSEADLVDLRRIEGTLEDVFVHLTGRELR